MYTGLKVVCDTQSQLGCIADMWTVIALSNDHDVESFESENTITIKHRDHKDSDCSIVGYSDGFSILNTVLLNGLHEEEVIK